MSTNFPKARRPTPRHLMTTVIRVKEVSGGPQITLEELLRSDRPAWLGVSARSPSERPLNSWWCFPRHATPGDLLLIYQRLVGIVRIECVESEPENREMRCAQARLLTADTSFVRSLAKPISVRTLKADKILRHLPAVRRNFQGTCFSVPGEYWPRLLQLIIDSTE